MEVMIVVKSGPLFHALRIIHRSGLTTHGGGGINSFKLRKWAMCSTAGACCAPSTQPATVPGTTALATNTAKGLRVIFIYVLRPVSELDSGAYMIPSETAPYLEKPLP